MKTGRKGLVEPGEELQAWIRSQLKTFGPTRAAEILGMNKETCLAIGCGVHVTKGSIALAESAQERVSAQLAGVSTEG